MILYSWLCFVVGPCGGRIDRRRGVGVPCDSTAELRQVGRVPMMRPVARQAGDAG